MKRIKSESPKCRTEFLTDKAYASDKVNCTRHRSPHQRQKHLSLSQMATLQGGVKSLMSKGPPGCSHCLILLLELAHFCSHKTLYKVNRDQNSAANLWFYCVQLALLICFGKFKNLDKATPTLQLKRSYTVRRSDWNLKHKNVLSIFFLLN